MPNSIIMDSDKIISHFHEEEQIPSDLTKSVEFNQTGKIYRVRESVSFLNKVSSEDELWNRINRKINPRKLYVNWLKYAAIVALSFALGSLLIYFSGIGKFEDQVATINSPQGQITCLTLFDGSTVWLNSETTIQYSTNFNRKKREVQIEGEAHFEVAHNSKKPFIVYVGNSQVKVHGTSFNVKAYPGSDRIETVLEEGKVEFVSGKQSMMIKPGERVTITLSKGKLEKDKIDTEKAVAWKKGKYYYSNESLSAIIEQLQRWYEIEFVFDGEELSQYQFTGVINKEKSIQYNLRLIELTNRVQAEFEDGKVIIKGN